MKPWEETWRTNILDGREVECPAPELPDDDAYRVAEAYMGSEDGSQARFDRARLIAAAPEMARLLRAVMTWERDDSGHIFVPFDAEDEIVALLTKAGVPSP